MKKGLLILLIVVLSSFILNQKERVIEIMLTNNYKKPLHFIEQIDYKKAKNGESLIKTGFAINNPKKKPISIHFNCTHCHQLSPHLEKKLPASTLYGVVNRISWYNDDYKLKYGEGIKEAGKSLRNAIQFCAEQCAQGRTLDEEEIESILHYLWTLDLKTEDLDKESLLLLYNTDYSNITLKQSEFFYSKANFIKPKQAKIETEKRIGDISNGKKIYIEGCMHCHKKKGVTNFKLGDDKLSLKFLNKNLSKDNRYNLYVAIYEGTWAKPGYKPYMPRYTKENMSFQDMADLIAFIKDGSKR